MLMEGRREEEPAEEKGSHIRVMNPLTLDFHVYVATTKMTTFHLRLLRPCSSSDSPICQTELIHLCI